MGPRAGLDDLEKRKFLTLPGLELRLRCPDFHDKPVSICNTKLTKTVFPFVPGHNIAITKTSHWTGSYASSSIYNPRYFSKILPNVTVSFPSRSS
jgi:hypothetical protein